MIEVNGKSLETDEEGYLSNLSDWEEGAATAMAKAEDINLSEYENIKIIIISIRPRQTSM